MIVATILTAAVSLAPQDPGVSRELAVARSQRISDVSYRLHFDLESGARQVSGRVRIEFTLEDEQQPTEDVVLDFAGLSLEDVRINELLPDAGVSAAANHLLLPAESLTSGRNGFSARFSSPIAATGTPLSVYRDPTDGSEYYYTLVVPADAHRLFPCFDQPDIKGRFTISLSVPSEWRAVSNGERDEEEERALDDQPGKANYYFAETQPISTYLMAFAAGPFQVAASTVGLDSPMRIFHRASAAKDMDARALHQMHAKALQWLAEYFGTPYPFGKLDIVLVPGFPYGGMEHAGAIFYRESGLVFDHAPTESELTRRSTLIYHELSHQWFGNLVTMRWFDDLWLKEGFATFIGYRCLEALEPGKRAWLRFHQRVKPSAYRVDATAGTTPIYQALQNLADAKSAYGAIVYNKAPAVLRELHDRIGADAFREGVRRFLQQFAYGNAEWRDLAAALDSAATEDLGPWSRRWILTPSMPRVRVDWSVDGDGLCDAFVIEQNAISGDVGTWPLRLELMVWDLAGNRSTISADSDRARTRVEALEGKPPPACVLLNPRDVAYGQFLLDGRSRDYLLEHVASEADLLVRAVALSALWDTVREAELDPARFATLAIDLLANESDPESHAWLLGRLSTCLFRYLSSERRTPLVERTAELLLGQLESDMGGLALQTFRFLVRIDHPELLELCRRVARAEGVPPGLEAGRRDRFLAVAALLAAGEDDTELERLRAALPGEDVAKDSFLALAARPTAESKASYFEQYLQLGEPPEQWTQDSLSFFHWRRQGALTLPYLRKALEQVQWVKENRKIFFMPAWIDAFVNAHASAEALQIVRDFMGRQKLSKDIRLKLLQSLDSLERTVRIRERFE